MTSAVTTRSRWSAGMARRPGSRTTAVICRRTRPTRNDEFVPFDGYPATSLCTTDHRPGVLSPWAGLGMLALDAAVAVAADGYLFICRDS
jgi:hypothetical protein